MEFIFEMLKIIENNSIIILAVALIFYILYSLGLYFIFKQSDIKASKAFIPIINLIELLKLISIPSWMVILLIVPYINFIGIPVMSIIIALNMRKCYRLNILDTLGLIIIPVVFMIVIGNKELDYEYIEYNEKLIKDKVIEVRKDNVIDLPSLNVDIAVSNVEAFDATNFVSDKENFVTKRVVEEEVVVNEVESLTYDYEAMYKNKQ